MGSWGLCPILEKVPTSPLHPTPGAQASHATRLAARAGDTPTHGQAGGSAPTVGGTGVNPCCRLLPRRGVPCATTGTQPLLRPPQGPCRSPRPTVQRQVTGSGIHREFGVCRVWKIKLLSFRLVSTLQEHEVCVWAGGWTTLAFGLVGLSGLREDLNLHWGWEPWECVLC